MKRKLNIRLLFRPEGDFWCAYMAQEHTMDEAELIGTIVLEAAKRNPEVRKRFIETMKQALNDAIEDVGGDPDVEWKYEPVPAGWRPQ